MAFNHSIIQSFNHSIIQSFNQATKQPKQPKQPSNQATKQPSNQATLSYFYHFYQNWFKNPLLFIILSFINPIIPSFINPHNIFKKFDSISPIFNQWGLQS